MRIRTSSFLIAFFLAALLPLWSQAQTIASKIEEQGYSDTVRVTGLMSKVRDGMLMVQMEITNSETSPQSLFWRIKWLDADGFQVSDDEVWKPVLIQGGAKQNVVAYAPNRKAQDFRIQFNAKNNSGFRPPPSVESPNPY